MKPLVLAPCPYCGAETIDLTRTDGASRELGHKVDEHDLVYRVECDLCGAAGPIDSHDSAMDGWNYVARREAGREGRGGRR